MVFSTDDCNFQDNSKRTCMKEIHQHCECSSIDYIRMLSSETKQPVIHSFCYAGPRHPIAVFSALAILTHTYTSEVRSERDGLSSHARHCYIQNTVLITTMLLMASVVVPQARSNPSRSRAISTMTAPEADLPGLQEPKCICCRGESSANHEPAFYVVALGVG